MYEYTSKLIGIPPEKLAEMPWDEIDKAIEKAHGKPLGICYVSGSDT